MIQSPAGYQGDVRIKRYLDFYQAGYGVSMLSFGTAFSPLSLFAASEPGVWYDPSDFSTMFQDSAGTTPVTAVEQPVGLVLDKSRGLVLGSELVANPGGPFVSATGYSAGGAATISIDTGRLKVAQTTGFTDGVLCALPNNSFLKSAVISFDVDLGSSTLVQVQAGNGNFGNGGIITVNITASGTYNIVTTATSGGASGLTFKAGSAANFFLSRVSVRELPGSHASQATSASRPVLSARYNLLTYSEQFDNAAWTSLSTGVTVAPNVVTAPNGITTADKWRETAGGSAHNIRQSVTVPSGTVTLSIYAKAAENTYIGLFGLKNSVGKFFNLSNGTVGNNIGAAPASAGIEAVGDGWYRCWIQDTETTTASRNIDIYSSKNGTNWDYSGTLNDGIYIWGADLRPSNAGVGLPAYQRVTTATDYDTTGFPVYLRFDGTDDALNTASITPGLDKAQIFIAVRKAVDTSASLFEKSPNTLGIFAPRTTGVGNYGLNSGGSAVAEATSAASFAAPITSIVTGLGDIASPSAIIRVNGTQSGSTTNSQGTGNYSAGTFHLGARNGTTLLFKGNVYGAIIRFSAANLTAAEIASTETWLNSKSKAY